MPAKRAAQRALKGRGGIPAVYLPAMIALCILLPVCLSGCSRQEEELTDKQSSAKGVYRIYYSNPEGTALVRREYKPKSEDFEGILHEVLDAFRTPDTPDVRSALPGQITINSTVTGVSGIDVDFNAEYLSLDTITELLMRGALVRTLLQMPGVDTIRFTVESQSLMIGEEEIGPMTEDTFVIPTGAGINSYRNAQLTLYFPASDGNSVSRENRTVYYSSNLNKERLVIEQMLKGPRTEGLTAVAVDGTLVKDVSVSNGFCIVDFSEEINSSPAAETAVNPETVLYAFTNAIIDSCPEDQITGVRFRIEGSSDVRFRDQVNLDQIFARDAELIL